MDVLEGRTRKVRKAFCAFVLATFFGKEQIAIADDSQKKTADDDGQGDVLIRGDRTGDSAAGFVSSANVGDTPREVTDAASLVEPLPGVHVRRLGADDSFATLSIRGSSSTQVAVYLAGVPLSGGADPTLDLATLPLWPGARARVFRSFAPASFGRGSLGGTLVIDPPTPRSTTKPTTDIWMAGGTFGSRRLRLGDVRKVGDVQIATGLSASRSDDDFTFLDQNATLAAGGPDIYASRRNAGHAAIAGLLSVGIPLSIGGRPGAVTFTELAQARRQQLPGSASVPTAFQALESNRLVSAMELSLLATPRSTASMRLWGRREGLSLRDHPEAARLFGSPVATDDAIVAVGASAGWKTRPFDHATLEARLDGSGERFAPGTWLGATPPPSARRTNGGIAVDGDLHPGGPGGSAAKISVSGRGDAWVDSSDGADSRTELRPTAHVGAEAPLGGLPLILATHAGFVSRPPSFVELFGDRGAFVGNITLKPESAFTLDGGARTATRIGDKLRLAAELATFVTFADDLITFVYFGAANRARSTNIGEAQLVGVEGQIRAAAYGFDLRVTHSALQTKNKSQCIGEDCPALPGRPAHDFVADLSFEVGAARVRYGVDVVSGILADQQGTIEVPARVLHGASLRVALPRLKDAWFTIDVRNLLDARVGEYEGVALAGRRPSIVRAPIGDLYEYPLPGRRVLMSVKWVLGN